MEKDEGATAVEEAPAEVLEPVEPQEPKEPLQVPFDGIEDPSLAPDADEPPAEDAETVGKDAAKPPKDEDDGVEEETLNKARDLGFSDQEISELGQKRLDLMLSKIEARQQPPAESAKPPIPAKPAEPAQPDLDLDKALEGFDPAFVAPIKAIHAQQSAKMAAQEKTISEMKGFVEFLAKHVESQQKREYTDWLDGQFASMGDEYSPLFGKDAGHAMDRASPQLKARMKLLDAMDLIASGYQGRKQQSPSRGELFKQALRMAFGEKTAEAERKKIAGALDKRKGQFVARATNRESRDNRSPEERAEAHIRAKLKDKGVEEDASIFG